MALGIWAAVKQYTFVDTLVSVLALLGTSMPLFWLALLMMLLFSVRLNWLPATGFEGWKSLLMPAFCTSVGSLAAIARMTRSSMLEVIRTDYMTTARAKGAKEPRVIFKHGLGNALMPVVTSVGIQYGLLLGGAVLVETVFAIPGMGMMMVNAIKARNLPVVQGGVIISALSLCVLNLIIDILYGIIDPRIKLEN
jgi:peptide/nickel transport system permease protein